jgi:hypothetical protein
MECSASLAYIQIILLQTSYYPIIVSISHARQSVNSRATCGSFELFFFFYYYWWGGTKSLGTAATSGLLYKRQMIDEDDCGAIDGMKFGRGNRSTHRKPTPAPLCPPQISHDQTRARTPGRRGGKPATNRLSYGAALLSC